jgi:cation diffusion facilitator family transporter
MTNELNVNEDLEVRARIAKRCTWIGFFVNGVLSTLKIIAGIVGHSGAMIADGVHSISDFVTDVVVIVFIGVSAKGVDKFYRYGHGKFETFATMIISMALMAVAIWLFWTSGERVIASLSGARIEAPTTIALIMAAVSIVAKEALYQYTNHVGNDLKSMALIANAWHHRSDAFSSIATLLGISGAMFLSAQWRILDPIAAMTVSIFIAVVAVKLGMPAIRELLEVSLPESQNLEIGSVIGGVDGVKAFHNLRTRKNGNKLVLDFHIKVAPEMTIVDAHHIASEVERQLKEKFGDIMANIHIEPYNGENVDGMNKCVD